MRQDDSSKESDNLRAPPHVSLFTSMSYPKAESSHTATKYATSDPRIPKPTECDSQWEGINFHMRDQYTPPQHI